MDIRTPRFSRHKQGQAGPVTHHKTRLAFAAPARAGKPSLKMPTRPSEWLGYLQWALVIGGGLILGLVLQVVPIGYVIVGAYCILAFVKRIPSRISFMAALGALLLTPLGIVIGQPAVANGFSFFGFLLLSVGVVTLGIELIKERR